MKSRFEVIEYKTEKEILHLKVRGWFKNQEAEGKVRVTAVFYTEGQDRRFPVRTESILMEDTGVSFVGETEISLPDVFYRLKREGEETVRVVLEAAWNGERQILEREEWKLPTGLFYAQRKKKGFLFSCYKVVSSAVCIALLPMFCLDGVFALKGYKPLDTGKNPATGKRGVLLHANALTKRISGFTYSLREIKTNYFRHCYNRYLKNPVRQDNILFFPRGFWRSTAIWHS